MTDARSRGLATDDQLSPPAPTARVPTSRVAALVGNLLDAMYTEGDDAETSYAASLEELRANADEAVIVFARQEGACGEQAYPRRWSLIHAASQLQHPAALPFLRQVVLTPIPPERSSQPHSRSTVKEETVLRTTAVEGVWSLAANGDDRAVESLLSFLAVESISVRRASALALLAIDEGLREQVAERLPRDQQFLLEIRPARVDEVEQPDPTLHLREGRGPEKRVPPDPAEGGQGDVQGPRTRS